MHGCKVFVLLALIVGLTQLVVNGQDNKFPPAAWSAQCALDGQVFEIAFRSQSGDWAEDDMLVSLKTTRGVTVTLPLPNTLYLPRGSVSNTLNLCELDQYTHAANTVAYPIHDTTVLLFLSVTDRPYFDTLVLALVNVATGALRDVLDTHLAIKDPDGSTALTIKKVADGFQIRLITEHLGVSDGPEDYIEHWVPLTVNGAKIEVHPPIP